MNPGTFLLIILAAVVAFWAGSRHRHHTRTWRDHKGAVASEKVLRKYRWVTFRAAVAAGAVLLAYLCGNGEISFAGRTKPAAHSPSPTPHVKPSAYKSPGRPVVHRS
jgi:hypothetical protein